jgi:anti-sigma factor ChrR (cupin superfamily)
MSDDSSDRTDFDEATALALAHAADLSEAPHPDVKRRLMARVREAAPPPTSIPAGFSFRFAVENDWLPHPVPGIRMKVLAIGRERATLLLDVAPGTLFPPHHHDGDEECYVISGSVMTLGRRLGPGDFVHADAGSDHGELYTDTGAEVLLIVQPEDYMPGFVQ